jgi:hypothetical protein
MQPLLPGQEEVVQTVRHSLQPFSSYSNLLACNSVEFKPTCPPPPPHMALGVRTTLGDTPKGTVARVFLASVFFVDLLYMGLRFRG